MHTAEEYHRPNSAPLRRARAAGPVAWAAAFVLGCAASDAFAVEGGASLWVPGAKGPMAGFLPPPGVYFENDVWLYGARIGGGVNTPIGGNVAAGVKANIKADLATALWVTPLEILGGNLAFSATGLYGLPRVSAAAVLSGPILNRLIGGPLGVTARDATWNWGDPIVSTMIGWHAGDFHWQVGASLNIPGGAYEPGELSNVAFNRWIGDFFSGVTYLNTELGIDLSAIGGVTLNGYNPATDYHSGTELHVDVAASKYLTKDLSVGVIASHYQQVSPDTGRGATVGPFKGRDSAIGGTVGYTFKIGELPISTRVKVLREFDVKNRLHGTVGWLSVSFPLWVQAKSAEAPQSIDPR
jgi:hypothetical protein